MLAAVYGGAKQALPEDVLGGRVEHPKQARGAARVQAADKLSLGPHLLPA